MIAILICVVGVLAYKLYQSNKQKQIAFDHYMQDRVVNQAQPRFMVGPDGQRHPTWCPNCGRNL